MKDELDDRLEKDQVDNLYKMLMDGDKKNEADFELALGIIDTLSKRDMFSLWTKLQTSGRWVDQRIMKIIQSKMYYAG